MPPKIQTVDHLNQAELIGRLASDLGITHAQSQTLLKATLAEIRSLLTNGRAVTIPHLGTFDTAIHESRRSFLPFGFLPIGKGFAMLPKRRVPVFRTGKELRDEVYDLDINAEAVPA